MYRSYFGLGEAPFSLAPDPRYLYMSERHQEALAHLLYGVSGDGGFVLLTGEVGAGKTTICRCLLEQIPHSCDIAYLFNPKLTVEELLSSICAELRIPCPPGDATIKTFVDRINAHLLDSHAKGRHTVLIIDEAQNLSADVLEQMRLLTNLETNRRKLLQIILVGQPELAELLDRRELRQLAQRIVARYHLPPLTKPEISAYVQHRLEVAGAQRPLIPPSLSGRLYRLSLGVPRLINVLCDRALLGAYVQGKERVDRATLAQAAREVFYQPAPWRRRLLRFFSSRPAAVRTAAVDRAAALNNETAAQRPAATSAGGARPRKTAARSQITESSAVLSETMEWPADEPRARSKALAYAALFRAWGTEYAGANGAPAEKLGLRCRTGRGGLDDLIKLNRPAVLTLRDRRGREFYATLTALDNDTATVTVGTSAQSVVQRVLVKQWSGDYAILWRIPPFAQENIWPGEQGPAVLWLRKQLALAQGVPAETVEDPLFDDALVNRVKQFQRARRLIPDGAIGVQALLHLSCMTDRAAPNLSRRSVE
jgi:general secretion pathway protein A